MLAVPKRHTDYMQIALELAAEAAAGGDVPVGCVIVRDNQIIGRGANQIQRTCNPTRHAEVVAIEDAVAAVGEKFLEDATLYVTLEPCSMCAGAIVLARIPTVVFGAFDPKTGACGSVLEVADNERLNHRVAIRSGVLADECGALLSSFFANKRVQHEPVDGTPDPVSAGCLFLVPTPIGNMDDMTLRSVKTLREATVILCEDTRHTGPLLKKFGVPPKQLLSYHEHNEADRALDVVSRVRGGQRVALVSDAGMPGISDPGYRAVQACIQNGLAVVALPGPSAALTALAASGLPTDRFLFVGFPPQKKGRAAFLAELTAEVGTIVMYESPHRIITLLQEIESVFGLRRPVVVARELTKLHEEYIRGTAEEVRSHVEKRGGLKGEIVVLVGGTPPGESA